MLSLINVGAVRSVLAFLLVALATHATGLAAQENETTEIPPTATTERLLGLVEAMNTGSRETLGDFIREHYTDSYSGFGSARALTNYWAAVHEEVGPVAPEVFGTLTLGDRTLEVYWLRGTITRSWIGIRLGVEEDPPHRVERNSVLRGVRPRIGPRADRAMVGTDPFDPATLRAYLDDWLRPAAEGGYFSGSVTILKDGEVVHEGGYGLANRERQIEVTPETPFRLASVTKMFTGVAIAQLAEAGRLSYDDPLSKFIPEYPRHIADQVTVHHLLTHTSGIELDDDADYNRAVREATTLADLLDAQLTYIERLNRGNYEDFAPLTEFDYTNEGIDLLGMIVERASGDPWEEYLRDRVFEPAGMTSTGSHVLESGSELAVSYTARAPGGGWLADGPRPVQTGSMTGVGAMRPAGSGWSTAGDMARFIRALGDGTLIGSESYRLMTTAHIVAGQLPGEELAYGYTLNVDRRGGQRIVGHSGGAPGINTQVRWYPDTGWVVIVLSNLDRGGGHVFWHIEEMLGVR